ncbi:type I restriction modification DNA specificity domain protein [Streptococcus mitis bv. 2 str. SK95]|uniref:Type I restriction modification DNA specificity domain protein n=1 Tax=Streptococcus mitis bv. 2 str. SK95 TaxID=1000588 RepID=F9LYK2_STROR|nr:restriction endonuclease subunit S [Streptococcus mitis]EGU63993.1 type I restriction modification DNA specificity domain protein [Streptococcus mitis bv. 2 str. SK95]
MSEIAWEITSLSELGTFSRGKSKHRPRNDVKLFEGGKYPLVQTGDVKAANLYITKNDSYYNDFGLKQSKLWPAGTLCITIAANIAETAILSYPMCFPDSIVGFNANPEKSSELFVYYFFEYIKKEIQKSASGSIQDNINIDYLSKMRIKVPEKVYQDKIVDLLSSIDKKILLNNQINQELESMAKTLYDYWFVQFDFPDQNGKPYKSSGGKMVYHPELKREIPEGWGVDSLWNIANFYNGLAMQKYRPDTNEDDYLPVIKIREMMNGFSKDSEKARLDIPTEAVVESGDILFSWSATLEVIIWGKERGALNQHIFKVTSDTYPKSFIYFELKSYLKVFKAIAELRKTTMGHITQDHLKQAKIVVPPIEIISKIDAQLQHIMSQKQILENQNQELTQLRDLLLPMLMNGQVKVE